MTELNNLIENILNIKNDITNALNQKNASFTNFASYPGAIENIKTGARSISI